MNKLNYLVSILAVSGVLFGAVTVATASVITNPTTVTGIDAIDPPGAQEIDIIASGAAPQSDPEARSDFQVIQNFAGFEGASRSTENIVNFTDPLRPDIRFRISSSHGLNYQAGGNIANNGGTSAGSNIALIGNVTVATVIYDIDFGQFDTATDSFSDDVGVDAAAFTISGLWFSNTNPQRITADYFNLSGDLLTSQTATAISRDPDEGGRRADAYFGYDAPGSATSLAGIGSIRITVEPGPGRGNSGVSFDDFGFTSASSSMSTVPEPSSAFLFAVGSAFGIFASFRRRRRLVI